MKCAYWRKSAPKSLNRLFDSTLRFLGPVHFCPSYSYDRSRDVKLAMFMKLMKMNNKILETPPKLTEICYACTGIVHTYVRLLWAWPILEKWKGWLKHGDALNELRMPFQRLESRVLKSVDFGPFELKKNPAYAIFGKQLGEKMTRDFPWWFYEWGQRKEDGRGKESKYSHNNTIRH